MTKHTTNKWLVFFSTSLVLLLTNVDMTAVNLMLPQIAHDLHLNLVSVQWIVSSYLVGGSALVMLGGYLGDRYGHKNIFILGAVIFVLASLGVGLSSSEWFIILMRLFQGFGAALAWPLAIIINRETFAGQEKLATGLTGSVIGLSMTVGPAVGGLILHYINWRWVFFINIPIGFVAVLMTYMFLRSNQKSESQGVAPLYISVFLVLGILVLMLSLNEIHGLGFFSPEVIIEFIVGVALLCVFFALQNKFNIMVIDIALFKNPSLFWCFVIRFCYQFVWTGSFFALSLLFQNILGFSVLQTSWFFMVSTFAFAIFSSLAGFLLRWFSVKVLLRTSFCIQIAAYGFLIALTQQTSISEMVVMFCLVGIGFAVGFPALLDQTLALAPMDKRGAVSGVLYEMLFLGRSVAAIVTASMIGLIAPHMLQEKLQALKVAITPVVGKALHLVATGVRNVNLLKNHIGQALATKYTPIVQNSFLDAFRMVMLVGIVIVLFMMLATFFIKDHTD